ncbi:hypothetical protein OG756_12980 [Streptomyces sp. NBC_01310]|uniref:hypothetical protein n=1 Tax=Streptomyces sp. NBC_01310 TaxID=2903820 RepID=UPI0035B6392E|nr:hypothetical protein OG756_12980 [Streptomyces sp. NBC_01310]
MSFSFTDPKPNNEPSFSFTGPADVEEQLQAIADMAHEILRLVTDVRRQINN